jgi:hypothetical protein
LNNDEKMLQALAEFPQFSDAVKKFTAVGKIAMTSGVTDKNSLIDVLIEICGNLSVGGLIILKEYKNIK